jgi:hypothetical protein
VIKISKYDLINDILTSKCTCENEINSDLSHITELNYQEEFGGYENITVTCQKCNTIHFLNMNIPESEYEEVELEETVMPFFDISNRKVLRDLMWAKRKDLKGKDRAEFNQQHKHILDEWNMRKKMRLQVN